MKTMRDRTKEHNELPNDLPAAAPGNLFMYKFHG